MWIILHIVMISLQLYNLFVSDSALIIVVLTGIYPTPTLPILSILLLF